MKISLALKVTMDQLKAKKFCFGYFYGFVTSALTDRARETYISIFQALFGFSSFLATSY